MRFISLLTTLAVAILALVPGPKHPLHHRHHHFHWHYIKDDVTCYHQGSITSDGKSVFVGEVANNELPLGTTIHLSHPVFGRTRFVVKDHIGSGSRLDIYGPSQSACEAFGRQSLSYRVG